MYTLDSDILAILLAIISFTIPAINAVREKKKKERAQEQTHTIVEESPDELHKMEMEELFSELLGLECKVEEMQEQPEEDFQAVVESIRKEVQQEQEPAVEEPQQEGIPATDCNIQEVSVPAQEYEAKSLKDRIKDNPKDMVIFAEILKPKFKEVEN